MVLHKNVLLIREGGGGGGVIFGRLMISTLAFPPSPSPAHSTHLHSLAQSHVITEQPPPPPCCYGNGCGGTTLPLVGSLAGIGLSQLGSVRPGCMVSGGDRRYGLLSPMGGCGNRGRSKNWSSKPKVKWR